MYHKIELIGSLTKNPEMRYTPNGKAVCNMNVAVDDGWGDNKKTIWFKVTAWEKQAESCNKFLKKGSKVFVEGRLQHENGNPRVWESNGKTGASFDVNAINVVFVFGKNQDAPEEEIPF